MSAFVSIVVREMKNVQKIYLALLRAAIWDQDVQVNVQPEDVRDIMHLAALQGTGPLVFDQMLKQNGVEISEASLMQMKQQCVMSMMQQNSMIPILTQAWKALEEADIHPVLLKGFGLAQYYPQPHLRQWGDIDIYVGKKQYHEACRVLRETFPGIPHPEEDDEDRKHYNFDFPNTAIETHRISMECPHPSDRKYYEQLEEKYLTKDGPLFELNGVMITVPEDTFNVFYTFLHAWHHFIETGINVKQLCDIAILLHVKREEIDRERLKAMLDRMCLMEVWQLFMYILVQHLGATQEECPFYLGGCKKRAESMFERVLWEGASRIPDAMNVDGVSYMKRKWMTFQSRMADSRFVKSYAPRYARHKVIGDILHGIERVLKLK